MGSDVAASNLFIVADGNGGMWDSSLQVQCKYILFILILQFSLESKTFLIRNSIDYILNLFF